MPGTTLTMRLDKETLRQVEFVSSRLGMTKQQFIREAIQNKLASLDLFKMAGGTIARYQSKIIITLESEDVMNEKWLKRRFSEWMNQRNAGFRIKEIAFDPEWSEVVLAPEQES